MHTECEPQIDVANGLIAAKKYYTAGLVDERWTIQSQSKEVQIIDKFYLNVNARINH